MWRVKKGKIMTKIIEFRPKGQQRIIAELRTLYRLKTINGSIPVLDDPRFDAEAVASMDRVYLAALSQFSDDDIVNGIRRWRTMADYMPPPVYLAMLIERMLNPSAKLKIKIPARDKGLTELLNATSS